jgi:hypothetical protein
MPSLAYSALTAVIFTSAAGALVMCLLVFKYGFAPSPDELPSVSMRRVFITRLGHAVAGTCFAATAILAAVTLADLAGVEASAPAILAADERRAIHSRLTALTSRVAAAESRLQRADERVRKVETTPPPAVHEDSRPSALPDEAAARPRVGVRPDRPPRRAEPVTASPMAPTPAGAVTRRPQPTEGLGAQLQRDWGAIKRAFATAGTDLRAALDDQARSARRLGD